MLKLVEWILEILSSYPANSGDNWAASTTNYVSALPEVNFAKEEEMRHLRNQLEIAKLKQQLANLGETCTVQTYGKRIYLHELDAAVPMFFGDVS